MDLRSQRGLTLTELTVVGVLATIVMLALTGFYFNSQRTWLEGSSQALTQREATLFSEHLGARVHAAASAQVQDNDPFDTLTLYAPPPGNDQLWQFRVEGPDSLIHEFEGSGLIDNGPVVTSKAVRFQVTKSDSIVELVVIELASATGDRVKLGSRFVLYNR